MTTCRYCRLPHVPGDGHYAECVVIRRVLGPPSRMCRRCDRDAETHRLLCAECQARYGRTAYQRLQERKASGLEGKIYGKYWRKIHVNRNAL